MPRAARLGLLASLALAAACGASKLDQSTCDIALTTDGGVFAPQTCAFRIVTPGEECDTCTVDYVVALTDPNSNHVGEVALFDFVEYAARSFTFDPTHELREVDGQAIDVGSVAWSLTAATTTLVPQGEVSVQVTFDATFAQGLRVRGDGTLPVIRDSAP